MTGTSRRLIEGPRWHAERLELLWVDILGHILRRSRPGPDGTLESVETNTVNRPVGTKQRSTASPTPATCSGSTASA